MRPTIASMLARARLGLPRARAALVPALHRARPLLMREVHRARPVLMLLCVAIVVVVAVRLWPHPSLADSFPTSRAVFDSGGRLMRLTLAADEKYRLWTPLPSISPELVDAVLLHEDQYFFRHPGVNPVAIVRAGLRTYSGGARQGGSTVTMQLVRLMYRQNTRSPAAKLLQVARAIGLELRYSKAEILEAYLNLAPYGLNIEGVGAASLIYFSRTPKRLALPEAMTLAVLPQSPSRRALAADRSLKDARNRLYARWIQAHPVDAAQRGLIDMPVVLKSPSELPFRAPHVSTMLLADARGLGAGGGNVIHSTIDAKLQRLLERQITNAMPRERRVGINNASAMLVDTRDMSVRAVAGSADFFDESIDGQVDGTQARRSPGSTLKPFIYALGLDQGLLHPMTILKDAPTAFGPFSPENFDGRFAGPISAHDALIRSRNVPAVAISAKLSAPTLYQFLKSTGVGRMQSERHYGLGLALGGGEVTMEELVRLYATLANRGVMKPLRYTREEQDAATRILMKPLRYAREEQDAATRTAPERTRRAGTSASGIRLLSEEASFIVLDILRDNPRPEQASAATSRIPIAWKTGTSWGFRDAWTVGVFGPYVLAVWVGNFDGQGNPAFVGVQAAAPLFFQIADAVAASQPGLIEPQYRQPPNLKRIEVCAASGDLPNAACPLRVETWFIPGKSPIRLSTLHRTIAIDTRTGLPACAPVDAKLVRVETFEYWPSDLAQLFAQAGLPRRAPPQRRCARMDAGAGGSDADDSDIEGIAGLRPAITSPLRATTYTQRAGAAAQVLALNAIADADAGALHWFANGAYIGAARPGTALAWQPPPGAYVLRVVDDHGRADARDVRVEVVH